MTSERLLNFLYLSKNFYTSPKQSSGYAPDNNCWRARTQALLQLYYCKFTAN